MLDGDCFWRTVWGNGKMQTLQGSEGPQTLVLSAPSSVFLGTEVGLWPSSWEEAFQTFSVLHLEEHDEVGEEGKGLRMCLQLNRLVWHQFPFSEVSPMGNGLERLTPWWA